MAAVPPRRIATEAREFRAVFQRIAIVVATVAEHKKDISACFGKDIVIFLGATKAGKSTAYNAYVHGVLEPTKRIRRRADSSDESSDDEEEDEDDDEEGPALKIHRLREGFNEAGVGKDDFAETPLPCAYPLPDIRVFRIESSSKSIHCSVFVDTKGFLDPTKNPTLEGAAAILTDMAVRKARSAKIVWLQSYADFVQKEVANLDRIGGVMNRVLFKNAPVLYLFNKPIPIDGFDALEQDIITSITNHGVGCSEDKWPAFYEMIMKRLDKKLEVRIKQSEKKRKGIIAQVRRRLEKLFGDADVDGAEIENEISRDPTAAQTKERMQYLKYYSDNFEAGRVLYVDPRFDMSVDAMRRAIDELPPALGQGATHPGRGIKWALDFSTYSEGLRTFKDDFRIILDAFYHLLKLKDRLMDYPLGRQMESVRSEKEQHEEALTTVQNMTRIKDIDGLVQYERTYLGDSGELPLRQNKNEQENIRARIEEIQNTIRRLSSGDPFIEERTIHGSSWFWEPEDLLVYPKEGDDKFYDFDEELQDGTMRKSGQTALTKQDLANDSWRRTAITRNGEQQPEFRVVYTSPMSFWLHVGAFFTGASCDGIVKFKIKREVRNRTQIQAKNRELRVQQDSLRMKQEELNQPENRGTLEDEIRRRIQIDEEQIRLLSRIIHIKEQLEMLLEEEVLIPLEDGNTARMKRGAVIRHSRTIVEDFFTQRDGVVELFLEVFEKITRPRRQSHRVIDARILSSEVDHFVNEIRRYYPDFCS